MKFDWDKHLEAAEKIDPQIEKAKLYYRQYPSILNFIKAQDKFDKDNVRIIGMAVYAWMPTTLKSSGSESEVIEYLNAFRKNDDVLVGEIEHFAKLMNNSYVGASKFLHFLSPSGFPIWDSRVARSLGRMHSINDRKLYLDYRDSMLGYAGDKPLAERAQKISADIHGAPVTALRALEHCLYLAAPEKKPSALKNGKKL